MVRVYYNGDKSGSCYAAGRSLLRLRSAGLRPNLRFSSFDKNRKNKKHLMVLFIFLVPLVGLEPTRRMSPLDFESSASASFTTAAFSEYICCKL